ncbi:integrator complex subunit 3 homolog [Lucilia cuprina]|uniref:integrator complex subunit 3 homolog n=1 Tax=Lucilia cuprina TaxID=7375 RepID=UPI001F052C06|nr:integrator complex subunit 3 homolog [Lucilia cuprina]
MWRILLAVFISLLLCLQVSQGLFINPGYEPFTRQKRTTVCVEIKPNIAGSHEPYYMCKGPEFPYRPPNQTPSHFVKIDGGNYAATNVPHENNYQHATPAQNQHFGYGYQQPQQSLPQSQVVPALNPPHYAPPPSYTPQQRPPQMPFYNPSYVSPQTNHQPTAQTTAADYPTLPNNPTKPTTFIQQNNYEALPQTAPETSRTPALKERTLESSVNGVQENKPSKDLPTLALKEAVDHKINSEQFHNLIEEEVLGMPNLGFSHDEMLPFQSFYADDKMRLAGENSHIPPEYLEDPILRTFYNIDDSPDKHHDEQQQQHYNPSSAQLNQANNDECFDSYAQVKMPGYMPSAEPTAHMDLFKTPYTDPNSCCGCPYSFHPIFIAIPWFGPAYNELFAHMHPIAPVSLPSFESYTLPPSTQHQSRVNEESSPSTEDLDINNKKSSITTETKSTTTPTPIKTTKTSESSEEDLFVEDTTAKNGKTTKSNDDNNSQEDDADEAEEVATETKPTSTSTVRPTFKTMMHAAKVASSKYYANPLPGANPDTRKRQVHYITAPVYHPTNPFKRQYVRKLNKMYN